MEYLLHLATFVCIWAMLGISLNLLVGEAGMVSVAHAAFFGIGAYMSALFLKDLHFNFFLAAFLASIGAGLVALVIGAIFARLKEVYYVLGTVGFNFIAFSVFSNWQNVTGGPLGISNIPAPAIFGFSFVESALYFLLTLAGVLLVYSIATFVTSSSFGRVLHAIREDEAVTAVFGYSTYHYKVLVFVLAAMCAGLAGSLFASYLTYIGPTSFIVDSSIFILSIIILGGLGSSRGAIVGALLLILLPEALRFVGFPTEMAAQLRQLTYGLILVLLMLYRPQGILGTFRI